MHLLPPKTVMGVGTVQKLFSAHQALHHLEPPLHLLRPLLQSMLECKTRSLEDPLQALTVIDLRSLRGVDPTSPQI